MKCLYAYLLLSCLLSVSQIKAQADVTITSVAVPAATITQGSATNIVYIAKMDVTTQATTVNGVQVAFGGTHDANDLTVMYVYFNPTDPTTAGATLLNGLGATFAAPHTYNVGFSKAMPAGTSGYFIVTTSVNNTATDGSTIQVNGAANPLVFGFTAAPNLTNSQTNAAGTLTIQAADVTIASTAVPATTVTQGSATNIVYIAKMDVATEDVTVNGVQVNFGGTHDANDLTVLYVYFNPTDPTITGATLLNGVAATFAAPHTYSVNFSRAMPAGSSGYFIITTSINNTATDGNTIQVNGATNPAAFSFTTGPNITNNQTNAAGTLTIQASDVTIASIAVPATTVTQGSATNIVYIAKMDVATEDVTVNGVQVTFGGTHDANDLTVMYVYFNPTDPTIAGATLLNGLAATFAAPHTYNVNFSRAIPAGTGGYFIITANINNTASDGKTIQVNGATSPLVFGFTTGPNITGTQTNVAGILTIQAADVTIATHPVPAATISQGSATNVVYIAKMDVATQDVTVNSLQVNFGGTHDANDLMVMYVYFNPTDPTIAGSTLLNGLSATFAAPHIYNVNFSRQMTAGTSGYFIITVNTSATATIGNTIKVNGATNPVVFGFTTGPNITDNQTDGGGLQTLPVTLISFTAQPINTIVQLNWATASEFNNAYFDVEHSTDGANFTALAKVNGKGNTATGNSYSYLHDLPAAGNNFYRLKQVDIDNKITYSNVQLAVVKFDADVIGAVYPNPVNSAIRFTMVAKENKKVLLKLTDQLGRSIFNSSQQVIKGMNNIFVDASRLSTGNYFLQVSDPVKGIMSTQKILVQH